MTTKPGVESNASPASVDSMPMLAESCEACPIRRAAVIQQDQGADEAAHFLRVQVSELGHKLALTRAELRRRGVDPDIAYVPHDDKPSPG